MRQDPSGASLRPDGDGPAREGDLQKASIVSGDDMMNDSNKR